MKSRWIINLLLLAAIVILGLIARYEPGIETPEKSQAITDLKAKQVRRIHINRPLRSDLVLEKQASKQWLIKRAASIPADDFKVRALTRLVEQRPARSYPVDKMNLADLQLDPPYATVIFNDISIEFGLLEPIDDLRYVRVSTQVHLIPDNYLQLMETSFTQFVRPTLFSKAEQINAIQLPHLLVQKIDDAWETQPSQPANKAALQQFFNLWQQAGTQYIQLADPGQDGEPVEVSIANRKSPIQFLVVKREPDLILARPDYGIQYHLGNRSEAMLTLDAAQADIKD
ncbi:hypothetical protein MNBD_GAMMA13-1414 [hydrothermal vent metagenome]|uniref:DUF4340 domain-containing protein n=1 Tax=hydrothermal vent metagenome TaxID=652676 RepID=A0A3B0Y779_9ZZZZ